MSYFHVFHFLKLDRIEIEMCIEYIESVGGAKVIPIWFLIGYRLRFFSHVKPLSLSVINLSVKYILYICV